MKKALKQKVLDHLQEAKDLLEEESSRRDDILWERSDKWRDSEKGMDYEEKTSELDEIKEEIEELMSRLEDF